MKRRDLLLATGFAISTSIAGCLGGSPSSDSSDSPGDSPDSPRPPEPCEPTRPELDLPDEDTLNQDDISEYIQRIERQRGITQSDLQDAETVEVQSSVSSVTPYDEGFVVDLDVWGSFEMGDNKTTVAIRETVSDNVTVQSADTPPFSTLERLQETIEAARNRRADERCEGRVAAHLSQSEFETVQGAFDDMEAGVDDFYYLRGEVCYIGVKLEDSTVVVTLFHEVPMGVSTEPVTADQFDIPRLQEAIDQALSQSEYADASVSTQLTEEEYSQLENAFAGMEPDEDVFYYLQDNESYAAVNVQQEEGPTGHFSWAARYYVDETQVRVTLDPAVDKAANADFDDPTAGEVIVC